MPKNDTPTPKALIVRRLLYALMVGDPQWSDDRVDFILAIARDDNTDPNGRVWWRLPRHINDPEGWEAGYVSLNPGEFRLERPTGPRDIIRDAPPSPENPLRLSDLLKKELRLLDSHSTELTEELRLLKQQAEKLLHNMPANNYAEGLNVFREAARRARTGEAHSAQEVVNDLYANCFFNFLLPGATFALAMALLQIQMGTNLWVQEDVYADVRGFLGGFLGNGKAYPQIMEGAAIVGNSHFEDGQESLTKALSSVTLDKFYRRLYMAAHHFWAATAIAKFSAVTMPAGKLNYSALIAEESWSCVITGLSSEIWQFAGRETDRVEDSLVQYFRKGDAQSAQEYTRDLTRPTNPILPKHYGQVSLARAMISAGGDGIKKGIERLHSLEQEFYSSVTILEDSKSELFRIESGLMVGYRELGDQEQAKRIAAKMVARAMVSKTLGEP